MVSQEVKDRLNRLIAMAMNGSPQLVLEVFMSVYGETYSTWGLHEYNTRDGTFAADSEELKRFEESYEKLIPAFKVAIRDFVDAI